MFELFRNLDETLRWLDKQDNYCPQDYHVIYTQPTIKKYKHSFKLENEGAIQVYTQDLPGVKKEDVNLEIIDGKLRLTAKRNEKSFAWDIEPSQEYDVETADAKLDLGVIEIRFNKREEVKKKIVVK